MKTNKTNKVVLIAVALIIITAFIVVIVTVNRGSGSDSGSEKTQSATEKPDAAVPPETNIVSDPMLTMGVGETGAVPAAEGDAFTCDRTNVLTVNESSGLMTANAEGYAIVTKKSAGGKTEKHYVTVRKAPAKVAFPVGALKLQKGETTTLTLQPTAKDEGFGPAKLTSSDSNIVSVSGGEITAAGEGTATVTGVVYNGQKADIKVTVLNDSGYTDRTTLYPTALQKEAGWNFPSVVKVPEGAQVKQYGKSDDGHWLHVKYGSNYGWIYNKAFEDITNYSKFTVDTLPVMADDLLFSIGTDKREIFDFVYAISYGANEDDTDENLCVDYFKTEKGNCFTHGAMLCYLYNRCGYETIRVVGISALDHVNEHSWCLSKTVNGTLQPVKVGMFEIVVFFIKIRIVNSVGTGKIEYALGIIGNEFRSDFHTYFMCSAQADDIGILFDIIHCLLIIIQRDEFLINQGTVHRIQFRKSSVCILRSG